LSILSPICYLAFFSRTTPRPPTSTLFPYTTLFRSIIAREWKLFEPYVCLEVKEGESRFCIRKKKREKMVSLWYKKKDDWIQADKIGRASCRERVENAGVVVVLNKNGVEAGEQNITR